MKSYMSWPVRLVALGVGCTLARGAVLKASPFAPAADGVAFDKVFDTVFDSSWRPEAIKHPKYQRGRADPRGALELVKMAVREVGAEVGFTSALPDFGNGLGGGTPWGLQQAAAKKFHTAAAAKPSAGGGMHGHIDYTMGLLGDSSSAADMESAIGHFQAMAEGRLQVHAQAEGRLHIGKLVDILRSKKYPETGEMFNLIQQMVTTWNAPQEVLSMVSAYSRMFRDGRTPLHGEAEHLANVTWSRLKNRTRRSRPRGASWARPEMRKMAASGEPGPADLQGIDTYKSTEDCLITIFKMPCQLGSPVCFFLTQENYIRKAGPGMFDGVWHSGPSGAIEHALGVAFQWRHGLISLPFYVTPGKHAVGTEFDLAFDGIQSDFRYEQQVQISAYLSLCESSACMGAGDAERMDVCMWACAGMSGGGEKLKPNATPERGYLPPKSPEYRKFIEKKGNNYLIKGNIQPAAVRSVDSFQISQDFLKYEGPVTAQFYEKAEFTPYASNWYGGFYRSKPEEPPLNERLRQAFRNAGGVHGY